MSTYQILELAAQTWPDHIAVVDGDIILTYQQLFEQTEVLKNFLVEKGLAPGMGLGVFGHNSSAFIAAMFAGMACGATVLPLSHQLKKAEIEHILSDTGLHAVLDDKSGITPINVNGFSINILKQTLRLVWTNAPLDKPITCLVNAAFIRYTSGTTGVSKGVVLSHQSIKERVEIIRAALKLTPNDAVLWVLPMAYHFLVTILVYICSGAKIILCKNLLAQTIIDEANRHQATLLYASPMHFRLLAADLSGKKMGSLKYAISTSSGIPLSIADAFTQRFNLSVTQAYGIIEAGLPLLDNLSGNSQADSVGYSTTGFDVCLLDEGNQQVAAGQTGRLAIRGAGMFDAYLKPWQTAKEIMNNGWFMTGDLAQRKSDGRIYICGREKTLINVSGNKVFPEEIESVLNSHKDIMDSRVFGQSHPLMGEIVCAEVIVKETVILDVEVILKFCRNQLSTYKVPQRLQQVAYIAHTQSGKIKRVE